LNISYEFKIVLVWEVIPGVSIHTNIYTSHKKSTTNGAFLSY